MTFTAVDAAVFPGPGTAAATSEARSDLRQRAIVEDGLAVLVSSNVMSAFEYLRARGIAVHVIARVLLEPLHRRAAG